jgi:hypothetical protein
MSLGWFIKSVSELLQRQKSVDLDPYKPGKLDLHGYFGFRNSFNKCIKIIKRKALEMCGSIPISAMFSIEDSSNFEKDSVESVLEALNDPRDSSFSWHSRLEKQLTGEYSNITNYKNFSGMYYVTPHFL